MIRGVVFDLDHTLFDRYATMRAVAPYFFKEAGDLLPDGVTKEQFIDALCDADRNFVIYGWPAVFEALRKGEMLRDSYPFEDYSKALLSSFSKVAVPFDFAKPTLHILRERGLKLALLTNGFGELQWKKLRMLGLENEFDATLMLEKGMKKKPEPEPFLTIAQDLGIPPEELVYVGDNPINDVQGSRNAGYLPVWVRTTGVWPDGIEPAPYAIDDVSELPDLLDRIN